MSAKSIIEKSHIIEIITLVALIVIIAGLPGFVLNNSPWRSAHRNHRVINLTAVAKNGVWTEEKVTNLNYWNKEFKPAELSIQKGEKILFRRWKLKEEWFMKFLSLLKKPESSPITVRPFVEIHIITCKVKF
jgi:membrane protein YdbS with pleckstrin-like domain